MWKKHPLSVLCGYVMLVALVVFGLAGLSTKLLHQLPPAWQAPIAEWAPVAVVLSLAAAFVAAAVASMRGAAHAERVHQAGPGYGYLFGLWASYTLICIVIEVAIGKFGLAPILFGVDLGFGQTIALFGLLTFFAVAPRLVSFGLSGMEGIAKQEAIADDGREKAHDIARLRVIEESREKAIHAGNLRRIEDARKAAGAGVAGAAMAAGALILGGTVSEAAQIDAAPVSAEPARVAMANSTADDSDEWSMRADAEDAEESVLAELVNKSKARRVRRAPPSLPTVEAVRLADEYASEHDGEFSSHALARVVPHSQSTIARSLMVARSEGRLQGKPWAKNWLRQQATRSHHPARRA